MLSLSLTVLKLRSQVHLCILQCVSLLPWIVCLLYRADDGNGKSTPIKRGPGRPRKRKYFGASSKGDKSSPVPTTGYGKEGEERLPISGTQSPELNAVASESESLVSKESEPPKKKKKRAKQKSPVERDQRGSAPPSRGLSPVELTVSEVMLTSIQYLFFRVNFLFDVAFFPSGCSGPCWKEKEISQANWYGRGGKEIQWIFDYGSVWKRKLCFHKAEKQLIGYRCECWWYYSLLFDSAEEGIWFYFMLLESRECISLHLPPLFANFLKLCFVHLHCRLL